MAERESPLRKSLKHESGRLHVSGKARYVDDFPAPAELLYAKPIMATEAHAKILSIDLERARGLAGVHAILLAEDIPEDLAGAAQEPEAEHVGILRR